MRRRRWAVACLLVLGIATVVLLGLRGTGEESPEAAIYGLAHAAEHRDREEACGRLFPSKLLPKSVARALGVSRARSRGDCSREFETLDFDDPRVRDVRRVDIRASSGVTAAATASVLLANEPERLALVAYRGRWRVVFGGS